MVSAKKSEHGQDVRINLLPKFSDEADRVVLACIAIALWLVTGPSSGMGYETSLINYSNDRGFLGGFLFGDPLRPFTSFSYHLANQFSKLFFDSAFLGMQIFYILLIVARAQFFWLLVKALIPRQRPLWFLATLLFTVYSADGATLWIGQMNQIACSFAALASLYYLQKYLIAENHRLYLFWLFLSFEFYSLWSYESVLFPLSLTGTLLISFSKLSIKRKIMNIAGWAMLPAIYSIEYLYIMLANPDSYRLSQLERNLTAWQLFKNLSFEISTGLNPVSWLMSLPNLHHLSVIIGLLTALISISYFSLLWFHHFKSGQHKSSLTFSYISSGILIAITAFAAFVATTSATNLWRTHLIAQVPLAFVISYFLYLQLHTFKDSTFVIMGLIFIVISCSAITFIERGYKHESDWKLQSEVASSLLNTAPCLEKGSKIILVLPPDQSTGGLSPSPFGDNMWLNEMLKLAYPGRRIVGNYISQAGVLAPGSNLDGYRNSSTLLISYESGAASTRGEIPSKVLQTLNEYNITPSTKPVIKSCAISTEVKHRYLSRF